MKYKGLSSPEAKKRFKKDGPNVIKHALSINKWKLFFSQFNNILIYILLAAFSISVILQEYLDAIVIIAAVMINTAVGFYQEYKAYNTLARLTKMLPWDLIVIRDGKEQIIPAKKLVVGDIVVLEAGNKVPGDLKLLESKDLFIDEAVLTGESDNVAKDETSHDKKAWKLYMGTTVVRGSAIAKVLKIGENTKFGQIAELLHSQDESYTPLQKELDKLSKYIGYFVLLLAAVLWLLGVLKGNSVWEMFMVSAAVAISAVPEGLVISMTAMLAIGMQKLLKKKALVRRLVAAETLGSVDVICTDKTGTLTEGKSRVVKVLTGDSLYSFKEDDAVYNDAFKKMVEVSTLSNTAKFISGKLIGGSLNQALFKFGLAFDFHKINLENDDYKYLNAVPFHSKYKYALYLYQNRKTTKNELFYMGMPEKALDLSDYYLDKNNKKQKLTREKKIELKAEYLKWAKKGYRILGSSYKECDGSNALIFNNGIFLGFLLLRDPLRDGVVEMIKIAQKGGIKVIMITGDHPETARAVGDQLKLVTNGELLLTGDDLDELSDEELLNVIDDVVIFARVKPTDKWRIVKTLQKKGHKVAMTGDGINDAPAIKAADIGIAVNSGTEVTKEVADLILMDNNFNVIVAAIEEGRSIFLNLKKIIVYLLADSFTEIILISGALVLGLPLPLTVIQILWVNLVADSFPSIALTMEKNDEEDLMSKDYLKNSYKLLDKEMKILIFIIGIVTDIILLGAFYYLFNTQGLLYARTFVFAALAIDSLIYVFSCKNLTKTLRHIHIFDNLYLLGAVFIGFFATFVLLLTETGRHFFGFVELPMMDWGFLAILAVIEIFLVEAVKYAFIVRHKK